MGRMFWNIWDAASYDVVELLLKENAMPNLNRVYLSGSGHPVLLNRYNSQTPCALAMQFTGKDSESLDIGGYHTPDYKSVDRILDYYPTFSNRNVGDEVAWNSEKIGHKRVALSQIPYSKTDTNHIYGINGFSKKRAMYQLFTEADFDLGGALNCCIADQTFRMALTEKEGKAIVKISNANGYMSEITCNENCKNDIWLNDSSGFKVFGFTDEDGGIIVLLTDVWEYTLDNIEITEDFRVAIGPFLGVSYGRLYRNGKFGKPYYWGGNGRAEEIFYAILEQMSLCFTRMNAWLIDNVDFEAIISYQPCIDEASHEFYGWWKNSTGQDKVFYWNLLKKAYSFADDHLACVLEKMDDTDRMMITSDHGIYEVKYNFYINEYLEREGLLVRKNGEIDIFTSKIFYHPAETGAMYLGVSNTCDEEAIAMLEKLEIQGHRVIRKIERPDNRVMGDYFLVPGQNVNIKADFCQKIFEETNKTGCHTVNTNDGSMRAICFLTKNIDKEYFSTGEELSYKEVSSLFIKNV